MFKVGVYIVFLALFIGVNGDCMSIAEGRAYSTSQSSFARAIGDAYADALANLAEGDCTYAEAIAEAKVQVQAVAFAFVDVFAETKTRVRGAPGCTGSADAKAGAFGSATARAIATAHAAAIAQVLSQYGYPVSFVFAESLSSAEAFEEIFASAYAESSTRGRGDNYDMDEQLKTTLVTAIAEAFATAVANYYCS